MRLRWKYFIVLLLASLIPMTVVTLFGQRTSQKLGESVSIHTQEVLLETVRNEIIAATENYAMITRGAKTSLEFALLLLTKKAEAALLGPPPEMQEDIYFAHDFENSHTAPKDLEKSLIHMKILEEGRLIPKMISYSHPNFLVPQGVHRPDVEFDIARFTKLSPVLKGIAGKFGASLFWIYASLESGVHISYPGHGGYPAEYDPRNRPWYILAKETGRLCWGPPIVDITTNQLTFTVSAPFFRPDGAFAGVAAIDVLLPQVLLDSQISSQWSSKVASFLVGQGEMEGQEGKKFWILSQKNMVGLSGASTGNSSTEMASQTVLPDFAGLIKNLKEEESGSLEMPYQGVDSFWAFATIFPDLHFVIIAPKSMVTELSEEVEESFSNYTSSQNAIAITAVVIVIFVVAGIALVISQAHTQKVMSIVSGFKRLEQGDFTVRLVLDFKDERDLIVTTFNQIMPRLEEHLRMSRSLGIAKDVQQSLLPNSDPTLTGFDIAGASLYCEETGGDYYDFITMDDSRLAVVVGDVSGHGVSSALLMATARALIMLRASMPGPTASIINDVNEHLSQDAYYTGNFMTLFYCELTASNREICWVRAGHDPALLYNPATDDFDELKGHGLALGLDHTFEYEEFKRKLDPGQIILIGTDGIWEMRNETGEMFGKEKLMGIIRDNSSATAKELVVLIADTLLRFRGSRKQEDDVTMVVIKVEESE